MKKNKLIFFVTGMILLASCKKDDAPNPTPPATVTSGVYTLNQGSYGGNNTTLTYYDFTSKAPATDYFKTVNNFGLGDTGSDFIVYGGKMYIAMNVSGYVAVANSRTAKFIDSISFQDGGKNKEPENLVAAGGKVFVSCNDGTVAVIDTSALTIQKLITVGPNPAQMAVSGNNLYVSNTGAFGVYDSTVSVIDISSLTETAKITVGVNPGSIATDNAGNIYVACTGNYNDVGPTLVKVDLSTRAITKTVNIGIGLIRYTNNTLLATGGYLGAQTVSILNPADLTSMAASFITDGTIIQNPYGLDVEPSGGDVYVGDAKDYATSGQVFCFDKTGKLKFSFSVAPGISPIRTCFIVQ